MSGEDIVRAADIMSEAERLILADWLTDNGRDSEAVLLRRGPVIRDDNGTFHERHWAGEYSPRLNEWDDARLTSDIDMCAAEYCNEDPDGFEVVRGEWYVCDDYNCLIYHGSYSNYHSPGSSHNTWCAVYESRTDYAAAVEYWESQPERIESDEWDEEEVTDDEV